MSSERPRLTLDVATTVRQLPDEVAEVVGYEFQTTHVCMDCGERIGNGSLVNHARQHLGLPPKKKAKWNGTPS
jgi:hypothetical protein